MSEKLPRANTVPVAFHVAASAFVVFCLWFARERPEAYRDAMQEDRFVEWLSAFAYAAAGAVMLARAVRSRRVFDGLVGAFLLFVAGEEMSWGQRLFGLTPPSYFLEHNTQQEMNVHNFARVFGGPKGPFTLILVGYAIVMPAVALLPVGRALLARIGATPPPMAAIVWFVLSIALFVWYPVSFTGEWNELLAGATFLAASGVAPGSLSSLALAGVACAFLLSAWSSRGRSDPARVTCASAELTALASALDAQVLGPGSAHRRLWTFVQDGRVNPDSLASRLGAVSCEAVPDGSARRRFAVDPWGTAYWMRVQQRDDLLTVTVYTFGPNRRRDLDRAATRRGDDVFVRRTLRFR